MTDLLAARAQMGTSLAFHIIFAALGVGLPLLMCVAEGLALRRKDPVWMALTRRWARASAILFAIGAVSGTILSFELGLLWPTWIKFAGAVIGPAFAFEGFAFFLEAIFLGLYLYGWDRLSPRAHWLCSFPIWISGLFSAWFIVSANAWMNTPAGFVFKNGQVTNIDPLQAMLNPSTPYETTHMILACYVATGFGVAAVYAVAMLRGKRDAYHRRGLMLALAMGAIAIPLQIISGDANARFLNDAQPAKLAAMEGLFHTQSGAPLEIGGLADPATGKVYFALEIPKGLSFLATFDPNATIKGLDAFAPQDRPDPLPVHTSFDGMVASGFFALLVGWLFWLIYFLPRRPVGRSQDAVRYRSEQDHLLRRRRAIPDGRWMLWGILLSGPLSFLAIELGWMVTELGRQPWVIYGYLRTADAVTTAPWLNISFLVFTFIYIILAIALTYFLLRLARTPLPRMEWSELASGQALVQDERVET
jgi:cytochrome bd ubiquinol oxidase subunit I